MICTSEQYFLEKCMVTAEDAKASFSSMSNLDLDQQTKQAYKGMMEDMGKHIEFLNNRLNYLKQNG